MTASQAAGISALQAVKRARPDLADRVDAVVAGLSQVQPRSRELERRPVTQLVRRLAQIAELDIDDQSRPAGEAQGSSWLAYQALDRALRPEGPAVATTDLVVRLAQAQGARFESVPAQLVEFYDRAQTLDHDLPGQIAWLAGHGGADRLVAGLADVLAHDPDRALDFLDAVIDAYDTVPLPDVSTVPRVAAPRGNRIRRWARNVGVTGRSNRSAPHVRWARRSRLYLLRHREMRAVRSPRQRERPAIVSTGFCEQRGAPPLSPDRTLGAGRRYEFFIRIAPQPMQDAIDEVTAALPPLPAGAVVQVVLFGSENQLRPVPGLDVGELVLVGGGAAIVRRQPSGEAGLATLYLAVETPAVAGTYRFRCNIYCNQALLQSRIVSARVTPESQASQHGRALRSTLDFSIARTLAPNDVAALTPRTLSVLLNDNGNGTHGFKFFGSGEFKRDITITGDALTQHLAQARKGLRLASWDSEDEPTRANIDSLVYRYANPSWQMLAEDLPVLARSGWKLWDVLAGQLSGGDDDALMACMRAPGRVEFANKQSLDLLVPAACLYDHPLDIDDPHPAICTTFGEAFDAQSLATAACFHGACPSYGDPHIVCASGFWGFRHQIGYSASLARGAPDDAHDFALTAGTDAAVFIAGASTDKKLTNTAEHLHRVSRLAGDGWNLAMTRTRLYELFRTLAPTVVYLYGHGGGDGGSPYFEVGTDDDGPIMRASLRGKANWATTRPVVFLNGCHSAALSPAAAFNYATGFLQTAHASAVLGTEIAVFESLAGAFAEECLRRFVVDRKPLGQAMLETRIALLQKGNPLGLAYLAFGPIDVHVAARPTTDPDVT